MGVTSTLAVLITGDSTKLTSALGQAEASTAKFKSSVGSVGTAAKSTLGTVMPLAAAAAGAAFAAFAKQSFDAAVQFDQTMGRIAALSNVPADAINGLTSQVIDLSRTTGQSTQALADDLFFLESSGLSAAQAMEALNADAMAAAAGLGSMTDLGKITAQALNLYASSGLTAAKVTDTLVATVRETSVVPEELAGTLGRVLPIASKVGISFEQVAASIGTMANAGLDATEGATALRGVLQSLAAPTTQTQQALKQVGLTVDDVVASLQQNGLIATLRMVDERVKANTSSTGEYNVLMRNIIPNVRALTGAFNLTAQEAEKVDAIFQRVQNSTGSTAQAFRTTAQTDAFKLNLALNDIKVTGQELAANALPTVAKALGLVSDQMRLVTDAVDGFKARDPAAIFNSLANSMKITPFSTVGFLLPHVVSESEVANFHATIDQVNASLDALGTTAKQNASFVATAMASIGGKLTPSNVDDFAAAVQQAAADWQTMSQAALGVVEPINAAVMAVTRFGKATQTATKAQGMFGQTLPNLMIPLSQLSRIGIDVNGFLDDFRTKLEAADNPEAAFAAGLQTITQAAAAWRDQTAASITGVGDVLSTLAGKSNLTVTAVTTAFQKAAQGARAFAGDLQTIAHTGGDTGRSLAASLLEMGPSAAGFASFIATASGKARDQMVGDFGKILSAGQKGAAGLQDALVPVLEHLDTILRALARRWGIDLRVNDHGAKTQIDGLKYQLDNITAHNYNLDVIVHTKSASPWPDEALKMHLTDPMSRMGFKKIGGHWTLPLDVAVHTGGKAVGNVSAAITGFESGAGSQVGAIIGQHKTDAILKQIHQQAKKTGELHLGVLKDLLREQKSATWVAAWAQQAQRAFAQGLKAEKGPPKWYDLATKNVPRLPEGTHGRNDRHVDVRITRPHMDDAMSYQTDYSGYG